MYMLEGYKKAARQPAEKGRNKSFLAFTLEAWMMLKNLKGAACTLIDCSPFFHLMRMMKSTNQLKNAKSLLPGGSRICTLLTVAPRKYRD